MKNHMKARHSMMHLHVLRQYIRREVRASKPWQNSLWMWLPGISHKNLGIPKIGNNKSAHQARFHSSPINRSPNLVWKLPKFGSSKLIWIHPNCQIWLFGSPDPNNKITQITKYLVIWLFGSPKENQRKPNLVINLEVRYGTKSPGVPARNRLVMFLALSGLCPPPNSACGEVFGSTNFLWGQNAIWAKWHINDCHCLSKGWPQPQMNHSINSYTL
jgi:hypothetical protein